MSDMKLHEMDLVVTFRKHLYVWGNDEDDAEQKVLQDLEDDKIVFEYSDIGFEPVEFIRRGEVNPEYICRKLIFNLDDEPLD